MGRKSISIGDFSALWPSAAARTGLSIEELADIYTSWGADFDSDMKLAESHFTTDEAVPHRLGDPSQDDPLTSPNVQIGGPFTNDPLNPDFHSTHHLFFLQSHNNTALDTLFNMQTRRMEEFVVSD